MHSTHTTKVHVYNEMCKHWCSKHIYTISKLVGTYIEMLIYDIKDEGLHATYKRNINLDDKQ